MTSELRKPSYTLTRQAFWLSFALAWAVIIALMIGALRGSETAVGFGTIALPSMVALIATLLGIHRFSGAMDLKTLAEQTPPDNDPGGP